MSSHASAYTEIAEAIVDHAVALTRLDVRTLGAAAYRNAVSDHIHSMRVLATPHVDPTPDRAFLKQLRATSAGVADVFVHFDDGVIAVIVDHRDGQHRFDLLSPAQVERLGDYKDARHRSSW